jgi:hypothetical protein
VSGEIQIKKNPPLVEGETTMNKLFTSTLLTVAAVPFLMAAPAAKKAQNTTPAVATAKTKTHKSHAKKAAKTSTAKVAPAATTPSK